MKFLLGTMVSVWLGLIPLFPAHAVSWHYDFNQLINGGYAEAGGHGPVATVQGQTTVIPDKTGKNALQLNGTGYLRLDVPTDLAYPRGLTIEAWICPGKLLAGRIVDRSTPAKGDSFCLDTHPGDALRFITPAGTITAEHVLTLGEWAHVLGVYDPEEGWLGIYLNGKIVAEQRATPGLTIAGKNPICIGADPTGGNLFCGGIDEVGLYDFPMIDDDAKARFAGRDVVTRLPVREPPDRPICYREGLQADSRALVSHNDVNYLSPAKYEHEALPVGNGRLCAMVWNADGLNLQLNHANNIFYQNASGRVRLMTTPAWPANYDSFRQWISLFEGRVYTQYAGPAGNFTVTTTVLAGFEVVAIHVKGTLTIPEIKVELEQWRPRIRTISVINQTEAERAGVKQASFQEKSAIGLLEDLPVENPQYFFRRMALLAKADCPMVYNDQEDRNGSTILPMTLKPVPDATGQVEFTLYVANTISGRERNPLYDAVAMLQMALQMGWDEAQESAQGRWIQFWKKSFIHVTSADRTADYMENLWYLHLYWMGCAGLGDLAVKFNGGAFLMHQDLRSWGTSYWYQNTRELYWPLPAANHMELCKPFQNLYLANLEAHRQNAKALFDRKGLQVEETMTIYGSGDKAGNPYTLLYLSTGLECALQLYRQYAYTREEIMKIYKQFSGKREENLLTQQIYPFLKDAVAFYQDYATKGDDGLFHITPTDARETYWRVQDGMTDISALREALPILIKESQRLKLDADLRPGWEEFLAKLAPLPENQEKKIYAPCVFPADIPATNNPLILKLYNEPGKNIARNITHKTNGENVELDFIYPFGLAGIGSANYDQAVRTYENRQFTGSGGWDWTPVCAARLGLAEEAARLQIVHCRSTQTWPQGFWYSPAGVFWANGLADVPYFDSSGVNATTTTEMVLQSYNGLIRVWPAAPKAWNGVFQLCAESGFLVTSERSGGIIKYVALESFFGDPCRIVNPWGNEQTIVSDGEKTVLLAADPELRFPTTAKKRYFIERVAAPVSEMDFAPLQPEVNTDVKYLSYPRRAHTPPRPEPGMPMLGITRDGLTPCRVAAQNNHDRATAAISAVVKGKTKRPAVKALWLDAAGTTTAASWLTDGKVGAENIPQRPYAVAYRFELPEAAPLSALVWSYDRNGGRMDIYMNGPCKDILVESSVDGQSWREISRTPLGGAAGQAIAFPQAVTAKFIKLTFLDPAGNPVSIPCDEVELY